MRRVVAALVILCVASAPRPAAADIKVGIAPSLTGPLTFAGELTRRTVELAIDDLNAKGGVLGEPLTAVMVDDQCAGDPAVLAARKLVSDQVKVVFGHICSGAAIPASDVYEAAGVPMFSVYGASPKLTERGLQYVFRLVGRTDGQAKAAAELLSTRYRTVKMGIVHDTQVVGVGLAADLVKELRSSGLDDAITAELGADQVDFSAIVTRFASAGVGVLYCACFAKQGGLLVRQVWESGLKIPIVGSNGLDNEDYWLIAGAEAASATVFLDNPSWILLPSAREVVERLRGGGQDPNIPAHDYAGVQAWAQAVERAKSTDGSAVVRLLHTQRFDTIIGSIGWNAKGDIEGPLQWSWYRWRDGAVYELSHGHLLEGVLLEKPGQ